jgi:hypothetical protein
MTTIQHQTRNAVRPSEFRATQEKVKAVLGGLLRALAESAKGAEHAAIFCHRGGAQFAALSRRQQDALLNRGYGPH